MEQPRRNENFVLFLGEIDFFLKTYLPCNLTVLVVSKPLRECIQPNEMSGIFWRFKTKIISSIALSKLTIYNCKPEGQANINKNKNIY